MSTFRGVAPCRTAIALSCAKVSSLHLRFIQPLPSGIGEILRRFRKVIAVVPPERVYLTTDCGMKPLSRMVAQMKLKALAEGAAIVRKELGA